MNLQLEPVESISSSASDTESENEKLSQETDQGSSDTEPLVLDELSSRAPQRFNWNLDPLFYFVVLVASAGIFASILAFYTVNTRIVDKRLSELAADVAVLEDIQSADTPYKPEELNVLAPARVVALSLIHI